MALVHERIVNWSCATASIGETRNSESGSVSALRGTVAQRKLA